MIPVSNISQSSQMRSNQFPLPNTCEIIDHWVQDSYALSRRSDPNIWKPFAQRQQLCLPCSGMLELSSIPKAAYVLQNQETINR